MQTVQNIKDGIWNFPCAVNSFLSREETTGAVQVTLDNSDDNNNNAVSENESIDGGGDNDDDITDNGLYEAEAEEPAALGTAMSINSLNLCGENDLLCGSHAIPLALIKEEWQLVLGCEASIPEIEFAIDKCKDLVLRTSTTKTENRNWLVRHLIELRHRLKELQDVDNDPDAVPTGMKVILGHHFVAHKSYPKCKVFCDHCSGIVWNVMQASYRCSDCSFTVHHKCIRNVIRICAHVITAERKLPIECICPEIGLAFQKYTCAECGSQLSCNDSKAIGCFGVELNAEKLISVQPRLCDYSGLYYCTVCHWNDTAVIPARIMNNWDFKPRKVSRASLQQIRLMYHRPVINLEQKNPRLFALVPKLGATKRFRQKLQHMRRYLTVCRIAEELRLVRDTIGNSRHLMQSDDMYSVADLVRIENGTLLIFLHTAYGAFERHIRNCLICSGKAYICEICNNDEIIFPFDDCAVCCNQCSSVTHRQCQLRKNMQCQKCIRLRVREQRMRNDILDAANGN
ncbi:differentially expressed in FDCP 8 homolog [Wyeomyia smithii]|uniref:differentially expressed in FDCP 8 homolog n=1 Tax=Wyeomyia smithii TaxID=174621 RepID=UPI002467B1EE|nr:differentially expressed in FDCP 8 homolog [Wyeomyia smithii]